MLNDVESDFVEFVALRNREPLEEVKERYAASKRVTPYGGRGFAAHVDTEYRLLQVFFGDHNERALLESYGHYAYLDILRMISYSFPKAPPTWSGYARTFVKTVAAADWDKIYSFARRKSGAVGGPDTWEILARRSAPTIVDYGCGLGYASLRLAQNSPGARVVLVDLDTVKLDFTEFRFKKLGIPFTTIRITGNDHYPALPPHDICIATDVMEHLREPLRAYAHIHGSMLPHGLLLGNFEDHKQRMFHVHPDLSALRGAITQDYTSVAPGLYEKR